MYKVVVKAWFRNHWYVYGKDAPVNGNWIWLATFRNSNDAANWAYDLTGEWNLK